MPEQLTKYPDATLQVLRSAGGQCGEGIKQDILSTCPTAKFCKFPGGEVCVYGLGDAAQMTQLTKTDWRALQVLQKESVPAMHVVPFGTLLIAMAFSVVAGAFLNAGVSGIRRRRLLRRTRHL